MKHLKLFENKGDVHWIVLYLPLEYPTAYSINIFDDIDSAENYYIEAVNDLAKSASYYKNNNSNDTIFSIEDAKIWLEEHPEYLVEYFSKPGMGTYKLPDNLEIGRSSKKFNV